jgi:hypothetical protein
LPFDWLCGIIGSARLTKLHHRCSIVVVSQGGRVGARNIEGRSSPQFRRGLAFVVSERSE